MATRMMIPALLIGVLVFTSSMALGDDRQDARLADLLKKSPEADANKDGKLTIEEARACRAAQR